MSGTHPNEKLASEEAIPRVFRVVLLVRVDQHWPLIATNNQFPTGKLCTYTKSNMSIKKKSVRRTHSASLQSKPAGQRRAPVTG